MLDMKNVEKVLACKIIDRPGRYISDDIVPYKCKGDVAKEDIFTAWYKGHLVCVEVVDIIPAWAYSESRKGLGNIDTMSYVISSVDVKKHSIEKLARSKIRDLRAAMKERRAKALDDKDMENFIKSLKKDEAKDFNDALEYIAELEANPNAVEDCEW